jgi:SWI/SNF-related matrix-associated actin-dependent regulator of chromatin subfamily D
MHHKAFDVEVFVNDPIRDSLTKANTGNVVINKEIASLDEKICALIQTVNLSKLKRDFMNSFVKDPVVFIDQWVASQSRDLEIVLGDTRLNKEEVRDSKLFENDVFKEALFHYLRQKEVR